MPQLNTYTNVHIQQIEGAKLHDYEQQRGILADDICKCSLELVERHRGLINHC